MQNYKLFSVFILLSIFGCSELERKIDKISEKQDEMSNEIKELKEAKATERNLSMNNEKENFSQLNRKLELMGGESNKSEPLLGVLDKIETNVNKIQELKSKPELNEKDKMILNNNFKELDNQNSKLKSSKIGLKNKEVSPSENKSPAKEADPTKEGSSTKETDAIEEGSTKEADGTSSTKDADSKEMKESKTPNDIDSQMNDIEIAKSNLEEDIDLSLKKKSSISKDDTEKLLDSIKNLRNSLNSIEGKSVVITKDELMKEIKALQKTNQELQDNIGILYNHLIDGNFDSCKYSPKDLKSTQKESINKLLEFIQSYKNSKKYCLLEIEVFGFADKNKIGPKGCGGKVSSNSELSFKRASTVSDYIESQNSELKLKSCEESENLKIQINPRSNTEFLGESDDKNRNTLIRTRWSIIK